MHPPLGSIARIPDPGKESRVIFSLHSLKNPAPGWIPHGKNVALLYHTFFEIKIFLTGTPPLHILIFEFLLQSCKFLEKGAKIM